MAIEQLELITVTAAQAKAIRKMALRNSKHTAESLAQDLFAQVVRGRFTAIAKGVGADAGAKFDMAVAGGFEPPMERAEYVERAVTEYNEILRDLNKVI